MILFTLLSFILTICIRSTNKWTMSIANDIQTEIVIMQKLNHPNIVSLYEVIDDPSSKQVYLVMEFVEYGPILPDENIVTPLPPELSWLYFRDIVKGVMYLHSQVRVLYFVYFTIMSYLMHIAAYGGKLIK